MKDERLSADEAGKLLDRIAELNRSCSPEEPWHVEEEAHDYPDRTTHFNHVRATSYVHGEPVLVSIGTYLTSDLAELLVALRNNLPELIRLARLGLEAQSGSHP